MASPSLLADIAAGNPRKKVALDQYNQVLAKTYADLEAEYGPASSHKFDPQKHLCYYSADPLDQHKYHETRRLTMAELGLTHKNQISAIGVSDPFPLFTQEATDIMKMECLQKEIFLEYARESFNSTTGMDCIVRGYAKTGGTVNTPFVHDAWTHPKTVELISTMAGVDLEVIMDYEIAQVNIGVTPGEVAEHQRMAAGKQHQMEQTEGAKSDPDKETQSAAAGDDMPAIVGWHYDSYPFVCVLMLSDTSRMVGGETYLRMGDKKVACVLGPQKGSATVLQGRLIEHLANKPVGATERITMVTSYRAKNSVVHEGSVLSTVKPEINFGTRPDDFYPEWIRYRSQVVKDRLDALVKTCNESATFNKQAATDTLKDIEAYLAKTALEMEVSAEEWETVNRKG